MARKKNRDGYVLKSEVQRIIQNYIRCIQMTDSGSDSGIPQLYAVMDQIEKMEAYDTGRCANRHGSLDSLIESVKHGILPPLNVESK